MRWRGEDLSPANTFEVCEGGLLKAYTFPDIMRERFTDFADLERVVQPNIDSAKKLYDDLLTIAPVLSELLVLSYILLRLTLSTLR